MCVFLCVCVCVCICVCVCVCACACVCPSMQLVECAYSNKMLQLERFSSTCLLRPHSPSAFEEGGGGVVETVSTPDVCVSRGKLSVSHSSLGTCVCETLSVPDFCVCLRFTHETPSHDRSHTQAHTLTICTHARNKFAHAQLNDALPVRNQLPDDDYF